MKTFRMKNISYVILAIVFIFTTVAFGDDSLVITQDGKVGINTDTPSELLTLEGGNLLISGTQDSTNLITAPDFSNACGVDWTCGNNWNIYSTGDQRASFFWIEGNVTSSLEQTISGLSAGEYILSFTMYYDLSNSLKIELGDATAYVSDSGDKEVKLTVTSGDTLKFTIDDDNGILHIFPDIVLVSSSGGNIEFEGTITGSGAGNNSLAGSLGIGITSPQYSLDVNGIIHANDIVTETSDIRLKKDIMPLENTLEKITQLQGVTFHWKDESRNDDLRMGVIAQDVEKVFPEIVATDQRGYKSVSYSKLIIPVIEAIKELKTDNDLIRSRINALENMPD